MMQKDVFGNKKDSLCFVPMPLAPSPRRPRGVKMAKKSNRAFCATDTVVQKVMDERQQNDTKRSQSTKQIVIILGQYQPGPNSNWQHRNEN